MLASIKKLKSRLSDVIEPDFGMLDQLLRLDVLTRRQYNDIRSEKGASYRRSEAVLDLLTSEDQCSKFLKALQRTGQQHVVNLITENGGWKYNGVVTYLLNVGHVKEQTFLKILQRTGLFEVSCSCRFLRFLDVFDHHHHFEQPNYGP